MMAGANRNPLLIQNRADVMRMNVFNRERKHAQLFTRGADDAHSFNR